MFIDVFVFIYMGGGGCITMWKVEIGGGGGQNKRKVEIGGSKNVESGNWEMKYKKSCSISEIQKSWGFY